MPWLDCVPLISAARSGLPTLHLRRTWQLRLVHAPLISAALCGLFDLHLRRTCLLHLDCVALISAARSSLPDLCRHFPGHLPRT